MQVLRLTGAAVVHATDPFAIRHIRFTHSAAATATIEDGNGREVASLRVAADLQPDDLAFTSPLWLTGLEVATISAGVLFVYLD